MLMNVLHVLTSVALLVRTWLVPSCVSVQKVIEKSAVMIVEVTLLRYYIYYSL